MKNLLIYPAVGLLHIYKWTLSPAFAALGIRCRHDPGCSSYSIEAFQTHGVWGGFWLTVSRLSRCHPWGSSGLDLVPETLEKPPFWAPWRYGDWKWSERTAKAKSVHLCGNKNKDHGHD